MELIYMSPDPFSWAFEASIDIRKCDLTLYWTVGLRILMKYNQLILTGMDFGTPVARIVRWRMELRGGMSLQ